MPIKFQCPCGQRLSAPDGSSGKQANCPHCGRKVRIPELRPPEPTAPESAPVQPPSEVPFLEEHVLERGAGEIRFISDVFVPAVGSYFAQVGSNIICFWIFLVVMYAYVPYCLGVAALIGFLAFAERKLHGEAVPYKEVLVPETVAGLYRHGFWSGLWASIRLTFHTSFFFGLELTTLLLGLVLVALPVFLFLYGLLLLVGPGVIYVGAALLLLLVLGVFHLVLVDFFTCLYLLNQKLEKEYRFPLFREAFFESWRLIFKHSGSFGALVLAEFLLHLAIGGALAVLIVASLLLQKTSFITLPLAAIIGIFFLPVGFYVMVQFLGEVTRQEEGEEAREGL